MRVNPTRRTSAAALEMQSNFNGASLSGDDLPKGSSIEIVLAKIICGRYIGFTCIIRYFDG